ncbi:hypothetical protein [Chlorobium ferrooxidans]|uniref:hypothetical protein n=1 Tax=Chlorobium ferrooxidans TaxID=84205 RepID=UPI0006814C96|nr:hypothetical protein [Chlorobium ferrooxidans]
MLIIAEHHSYSSLQTLMPDTRLTTLMKEGNHEQLIKTWEIDEHVGKLAKEHPAELIAYA